MKMHITFLLLFFKKKIKYVSNEDADSFLF